MINVPLKAAASPAFEQWIWQYRQELKGHMPGISRDRNNWAQQEQK